MLEMPMEVVVALVSVNVFTALVVPVTWFPKLALVGEMVRFAIPVPDKATVCGAGVALSLILRVAVLATAAVGANVTVMVQVLPEFRLDPQLLDCKKDALPVLMLPIGSGELRLLVTFTVCAVLVLPTLVLANVRDEAESCTCATPVPVRPIC